MTVCIWTTESKIKIIHILAQNLQERYRNKPTKHYRTGLRAKDLNIFFVFKPNIL